MAERNKVDNMRREKPSKIRTLVRIHWNSVPKEPMHLIGEPSTVKSTFVLWEARQIAKDEGREFFEWNRELPDRKLEVMRNPEKFFVFADVRASETDIGELRLQDMMNGEQYITFKYNLLFTVLSQKLSRGILFLDEFNNAPDMIKTQFYKIINDRAIGDIPIADGVLVVSAGNEIEQARGVTEDPVPLVLRRANYFISPPSQEEFQEYGFSTGLHEWVMGYTSFAPSDVHAVVYDNPNSIGQPCSRTWTKLSNVLRSNQGMAMDDVQAVSRAFVGQAAGDKFVAYVQMAKRVNIADILAHPEKVKEFSEHKDLSIIYAVITGVIEKFRIAAERKKVLDPALEISLNIRTELGVFMLRQIKNLDESFFMRTIVGHPKFVSQITPKYGKYFAADN